MLKARPIPVKFKLKGTLREHISLLSPQHLHYTAYDCNEEKSYTQNGLWIIPIPMSHLTLHLYLYVFVFRLTASPFVTSKESLVSHSSISTLHPSSAHILIQLMNGCSSYFKQFLFKKQSRRQIAFQVIT